MLTIVFGIVWLLSTTGLINMAAAFNGGKNLPTDFMVTWQKFSKAQKINGFGILLFVWVASSLVLFGWWM